MLFTLLIDVSFSCIQINYYAYGELSNKFGFFFSIPVMTKTVYFNFYTLFNMYVCLTSE